MNEPGCWNITCRGSFLGAGSKNRKLDGTPPGGMMTRG